MASQVADRERDAGAAHVADSIETNVRACQVEPRLDLLRLVKPAPYAAV